MAKDLKIEFIKKIRESSMQSKTFDINFYLKALDQEPNENIKALIMFLIYRRSSEISDVEIKSFDADVSIETINLFKEYYPFYADATIEPQRYGGGVKYELLKDGVNYRGDTMTSAWTSLKEYAKLVLGVNRIAQDDDWEDFIFRNRHELNVTDALGQFLSNNHTPGNFIPVPLGFNTARSRFGKQDFWDITLSYIWKYYKSGRDVAVLEELLGNNEDAVKNTQNWLNLFGNWEDFIKLHYLEDFVDGDKPIQFYEGHTNHNSVPKTLNDFESLFKNASRIMILRNSRIKKSK